MHGHEFHVENDPILLDNGPTTVDTWDGPKSHPSI
jgi:hypothetical protein